MKERRLNTIFRRKMWINLFFEVPIKKKLEESQCPETPCLRHFFAGNDQHAFLLYPNSGVDRNGFMFQFRLLIQKKNEA